MVLLGPSAAPRDAVYLRLDAMISEMPEYDAQPTQSQVEDGETISDHVTLKPVKLAIQGIVTDTPVSFDREFSSQFATPSPSKAAHIFLKTLYENRIPFDFVGGLDVYKSMVISKYAPQNTAETGDSLRFHCTMEQVKTVSTQIITTKKASPKTSQGSQLLGKTTPLEDKSVHDSFQSISPTQSQSAGSDAVINQNPAVNVGYTSALKFALQ